MTFDATIPDLGHYNAEMRKSLVDKIFFVDKIDAEVIVDYGCADGATIAFLKAIFPEKTYLGFDISPSELDHARRILPDVDFHSDYDALVARLSELRQAGLRTAVVCNSLIHEVHSYGTPGDAKEFWSRIFSDAFDYVVIRDMSVSESTTRQSDTLSVLRIRQRYDRERLRQFETTWGSINENWSLVHFLLKYRYVENWAREVKENYLPLNYEDLLTRIPDGWDPIFHEHFTLPFIRQQVKKDFNIELQDRTHVKLILQRIG
jgi:SAM-dependent methyltransferase